MIMRPTGLRINNDCAGMAQAQFTRPTYSLEMKARLKTLLWSNSLLKYPKK
jgi:hypothetical protein